MTLFNPISTSRRLDPRSLLRRGRESAEAIVRETIPHVEVERAPRRRRSASTIIIVAVLTLVAAAIVYLIWQRRDHEHARLVTEPERPDMTPASPSEPETSPPEAPDEPAAEPPRATSFTPPAVADVEPDNGDEVVEEDAPAPETAPPAREPATARAPVAPVASIEVAPLSSSRADDIVQRRVERRLRLPGAAAISMPGGGINLPARRPATPPRA